MLLVKFLGDADESNCNQLDCQNSFSACTNFWTCCSETNPCQIDEGDCDSDNDCTGNLRCGVGNCGSMYPSNSDCCETKGNKGMMEV